MREWPSTLAVCHPYRHKGFSHVTIRVTIPKPSVKVWSVDGDDNNRDNRTENNMTITSIKPRRDGKFMVGLHFNQGTSLRKIMTQEELGKTKEQIAEDIRQAEEYRRRNSAAE